jgi:hypothetical protein
MCAYANFVRFIESVFERSEVWQSGHEFERFVAERLQGASNKSNLTNLAVIGPVVCKARNEREEIDLLIISNASAFIGEVKFDCFSSDEISVYQHIDKMRKACGQARRKADFLKKNWAVIAPRLGLSLSVANFSPFAMTEKPFLGGFSYDDVPILALRDLEDFFDGEIKFNVVIERGVPLSDGEVVKTFRSAGTLADDLRSYLIESPRSMKFVERLRVLRFLRPSNDVVSNEYSRFQLEVS